MATRGWMSRAASRDPQGWRVPWTGMARTPALADRALKARWKLRGSRGRPSRGGKDVTGRDPEGARGVLQRCLGLVMQTECGEADGGQGQDGVGGLNTLQWINHPVRLRHGQPDTGSRSREQFSREARAPLREHIR